MDIAVVNKKTKSEFLEIYHRPKFIAIEYIKILKKIWNELKENIQMIHVGSSYIMVNVTVSGATS